MKHNLAADEFGSHMRRRKYGEPGAIIDFRQAAGMRFQIRWGKGSESGVTRRIASVHLLRRSAHESCEVGLSSKERDGQGRDGQQCCALVISYKFNSKVYSIKINSLSMDELQLSVSIKHTV